MKRDIGGRTGAALGLWVLLLGMPAAAQTPAAAAASNRLPRTPEGKPDWRKGVPPGLPHYPGKRTMGSGV